MRLDHLALVEQREPSGRFQNTLNDEHHIRTAGVVFVEAERDIVLQSPWQNALAELGDLLAILDHDGVFADQIDPADVAVEIDADARPVEPRCHLLDVSGLAGTMVTGDNDATVFREARKNGKRRRSVEAIIGIDIRYVLIGLRVSRHFKVTVDSKNLPDRHFHVGHTGDFLYCSGHCSSVASERRNPYAVRLIRSG